MLLLRGLRMSFTYEFRIEYSCNSCVLATQKLLSSIDNVASFQTDLLNKTVKVTCKEYVDPELLRAELGNVKPTSLISAPSFLDIPYTMISKDDISPLEIDIDFPPLDDRDIERMRGYLGLKHWPEEIFIDSSVSVCRFRIILKPNMQVSRSDIDELLDYHERGKEGRYIVGHDKLIHFRILGLRSEQDAQAIDVALNDKNAYIKHKLVNYSTQSILITANIEKKNVAAFIKMLNDHLKETYPEGSFILEPIASPGNNNNDLLPITHTSFFRRALLNVAFVLGMILLGGYIPLPFTLMGKLVGLSLGGMTLSMMWKTGGEFYREAWNAFKRKGSSNMYTLIALGTGSAWVYSMMLVLAPGLFPIAALQYQFLAVNMILGIINFGRGIRVRAEDRTRQMVQSQAEIYAENQPQVAKKVLTESPTIEGARLINQQIPYKTIKEGDIIFVDEGERFPVEGVIISETETMVEQAALTGESTLIYKKKDDPVFSGSFNNKHAVLIKATCDGDKGHLTRVMEEVAKSKSSTPSILGLVDKISNIFVPGIIGLTALTALGWLIIEPSLMINSAMSVLLCACPCALALAVIPISIGVYELLNQKILVRDASALEYLAKVNTVVWDKTGTFTTPAVEEVFIGDKKYRPAQVIQLAASLEKACLDDDDIHPIARSFIDKNSNRKFLPCRSAFKSAQGVTGVVVNEQAAFNIDVGSLSHMRENNIEISDKYIKEEDRLLKSGKTATFIAINKQCVGVVGLKHRLRDDAQKAVSELRAMGIEVYLLTGDKKEPALDIAKKLKIPEMRVGYEMNKDDKRVYVNKLKKEGWIILGMGDGFNDLPFLDVCDVSGAVGSWTCAAGSSKLAFQKLNVVAAIIIARETMRNIRQNLYLTGFYNLISLAAAVCGVLNPVIASISMAFSSIFVIVNSSRLTFEVEHQLAMHEGKIARPATWSEKLKSLLSLNTFLQTMEMFLNMAQDKQRTIPSNRNLKPTFVSTLINNAPKLPGGSPSKSATPEYAIEYNPQRRNPRIPLSAVSLVERFNGVSHRP